MKYLNKMTLIAAAAALIGATPALAQDLKPFTFSMNISAGGSQAGFVYAKALGLYEAEGLDVTIVEGKGSATTAQIVATGQVDLAMADAPTIMQLRARGAPIKIIAPILQANAYAIISLEGSGIETSKDMEGRRIGVDPGTAMAALFRGIVAHENLDQDKIEIVNVSIPAQVSTLLEEKVDAILSGDDFQGVQVRDVKPTNSIMFKDVGIPAIGLSVFGREDKLAENAEAVTAFLRAGFAGWQAAKEDPVAAANAVKEAFPTVSADQIVKQLEIDNELLCLSDSETMGRVSKAIWDANYEILTTYLDVAPDNPIETYYTEEYLPEDMPSCK